MARPPSTNGLALMMLPIAGLCLWAAWPRHAPPKKIPAPAQPFRLHVKKFVRVPLTPRDVSYGADTKVQINIVGKGTPRKPLLFTNGWSFGDQPYIVAVKNGIETRITDENRLTEFASQRVFRGGGGGGSDDWKHLDFGMVYRLRLKDVPLSYGALFLKWEWVYGVGAASSQAHNQVMRNARLGKNAFAAVATLPLRSANQRIAPVRASTDTLFDVRKIEVGPKPGSLQEFRVALSFFYHGPVSKPPYYANCEWGVYDDTNKPYLHATGGSIPRLKRGLRNYEIEGSFDINYLREAAKNKRRLFLRGHISLNEAWPRRITIPLPSWPLKATIVQEIPPPATNKS